MADLLGNLLVAQSGGTTATINASLVGAIIEAGRHPDQIEEIYGALHGFSGILREELIDLQDEKQNTVEGLKHTPVPALGLGRYTMDFGDSESAKAELDRLFTVFQTHNIRYFLQMGGREAVESSLKLHEEAVKRGYEMRIVAVPKSLENDLPHADGAPGYGSAIKYGSTIVLEIAAALRASNEKICCLVEVAGAATGWIPAGAVLARRNPGDGPHVILLPEVTFDQAGFLKQVQAAMESCGHCLAVVGENTSGGANAAGSSTQLADLIQKSLNLKTATVKVGLAQRSAAHLASAADVQNALALGAAAVRAAASGQSGLMVKTTRQTAHDGSVKWSTDVQALGDVLGAVNSVPRDWLSEDGFLPNDKFIAFAQPLVEGEARPAFENGLPKLMSLEKVPVEKKLPPYV